MKYTSKQITYFYKIFSDGIADQHTYDPILDNQNLLRSKSFSTSSHLYFLNLFFTMFRFYFDHNFSISSL